MGHCALGQQQQQPVFLPAHLCEREDRSFMRVAAVWRLAEPRCTRAITSSAEGWGATGAKWGAVRVMGVPLVKSPSPAG